MQVKNTYAQLYFFATGKESEVRATLARTFHCTFAEEHAKSTEFSDDEYTLYWRDDAFGFEISFRAMARRDDGMWYLLTLNPGFEISAPDVEAPLQDFNFHVAQMLRLAGFGLVVTREEYRDHHDRPAPPRPDAAE